MYSYNYSTLYGKLFICKSWTYTYSDLNILKCSNLFLPCVLNFSLSQSQECGAVILSLEIGQFGKDFFLVRCSILLDSSLVSLMTLLMSKAVISNQRLYIPDKAVKLKNEQVYKLRVLSGANKSLL